MLFFSWLPEWCHPHSDSAYTEYSAALSIHCHHGYSAASAARPALSPRRPPLVSAPGWQALRPMGAGGSDVMGRMRGGGGRRGVSEITCWRTIWGRWSWVFLWKNGVWAARGSAFFLKINKEPDFRILEKTDKRLGPTTPPPPHDNLKIYQTTWVPQDGTDASIHEWIHSKESVKRW